MSGKKGMKDYSLKVKLEAVRMFLEEGKTKAAIRESLAHQRESKSLGQAISARG